MHKRHQHVHSNIWVYVVTSQKIEKMGEDHFRQIEHFRPSTPAILGYSLVQEVSPFQRERITEQRKEEIESWKPNSRRITKRHCAYIKPWRILRARTKIWMPLLKQRSGKLITKLKFRILQESKTGSWQRKGESKPALPKISRQSSKAFHFNTGYKEGRQIDNLPWRSSVLATRLNKWSNASQDVRVVSSTLRSTIIRWEPYAVTWKSLQSLKRRKRKHDRSGLNSRVSSTRTRKGWNCSKTGMLMPTPI